ncbi:MAG: winged helix-turn-helix domain-containing protein [Chloroflexi bacterium]|nr:winged helix-turn-helix domain-containing protein [Chloroflexota bacterium]MBP8059263.1 winged helix-turn-helix domain-containing protein [Chloroflexota bacterium]
MSVNPAWDQLPASYRAQEMKTVARWLSAGESGSVIGLPGTGRATFLGFLCHRPDALRQYLTPYSDQVILMPVDLNNLPDEQLSTFYRVLLRSFYERYERQEDPMRSIIETLYRKVEATQDPFLSQSALRELLTLWEIQGRRIVLVMNRFDHFCETATPQMTTTLRGLRDSFKETLSYVMGMAQEVVYLSDLDSIRPLRGILDTHICWVGPLPEPDARFMIERQMQYHHEPVAEAVIARLLQISGGYPSLLRVLCHWWLTEGQKVQPDAWAKILLGKRNVQHRLRDIYQGFTQAEQFVLSELHQIQSGEKRSNTFSTSTDSDVLNALWEKGACFQQTGRWYITGELLDLYVKQEESPGRGRVWVNERTGEIHQGRTVVEGLQPLPWALLRFLLARPRERHTHTDLIEAVWPEEVNKDGVSTEALYQVVRGIRKAIEPDSTRPRYLINWRGYSGGGYQFFPEGRPG